MPIVGITEFAIGVVDPVKQFSWQPAQGTTSEQSLSLAAKQWPMNTLWLTHNLWNPKIGIFNWKRRLLEVEEHFWVSSSDTQEQQVWTSFSGEPSEQFDCLESKLRMTSLHWRHWQLGANLPSQRKTALQLKTLSKEFVLEVFREITYLLEFWISKPFWIAKFF